MSTATIAYDVVNNTKVGKSNKLKSLTESALKIDSIDYDKIHHLNIERVVILSVKVSLPMVTWLLKK